MVSVMRKGVLLIVIGVAMVIFDLTIEPVFSLPITASFKFPVGILAVIVGVLYVLSARIAQDSAQLTPGELAEWGKPLELATPRIIALSEQQLSTEYIAETVENETRIPQDILIKYMYALRQYVQASAEQAEAEDRRGA